MARRQLGRRLAELRRQAGRTQEDVAAELDVSVATVVRIETGRAPVKRERVLMWCNTCGAEPSQTAALMGLADGTRSKGLWQDEAVIPDWFDLYLGMERACREIEAWEPEMVHGLFQTPEYAHALIGAGQADTATVDARVAARMRRQEAVLGSRRVTILMGPGALLVQVGTPEIMRTQVAHLRKLSTRPNVYMGIVPWQAGSRRARGPFTILTFEDANDPDVAYVEMDTGGVYLEKDRELAVYRQSFAHLHQLSVPIEEYQE